MPSEITRAPDRRVPRPILEKKNSNNKLKMRTDGQTFKITKATRPTLERGTCYFPGYCDRFAHFLRQFKLGMIIMK